MATRTDSLDPIEITSIRDDRPGGLARPSAHAPRATIAVLGALVALAAAVLAAVL
ncbi:MAG: hypothetical protein JWL73_2537, partial [Actinomycetia bacterium]|nr:hypothetical protein [Actinomycetes bacterium]